MIHAMVSIVLLLLLYHQCKCQHNEKGKLYLKIIMNIALTMDPLIMFQVSSQFHRQGLENHCLLSSHLTHMHKLLLLSTRWCSYCTSVIKCWVKIDLKILLIYRNLFFFFFKKVSSVGSWSTSFYLDTYFQYKILFPKYCFAHSYLPNKTIFSGAYKHLLAILMVTFSNNGSQRTLENLSFNVFFTKEKKFPSSK